MESLILNQTNTVSFLSQHCYYFIPLMNFSLGLWKLLCPRCYSVHKRDFENILLAAAPNIQVTITTETFPSLLLSHYSRQKACLLSRKSSITKCSATIQNLAEHFPQDRKGEQSGEWISCKWSKQALIYVLLHQLFSHKLFHLRGIRLSITELLQTFN